MDVERWNGVRVQTMTLDPNPHFAGPWYIRLIRRLLWLTPIYRAARLDHSPSMSFLGKCPCLDCAGHPSVLEAFWSGYDKSEADACVYCEQCGDCITCEMCVCGANRTDKEVSND